MPGHYQKQPLSRTMQLSTKVRSVFGWWTNPMYYDKIAQKLDLPWLVFSADFFSGELETFSASFEFSVLLEILTHLSEKTGFYLKAKCNFSVQLESGKWRGLTPSQQISIRFDLRFFPGAKKSDFRSSGRWRGRRRRRRWWRCRRQQRWWLLFFHRKIIFGFDRGKIIFIDVLFLPRKKMLKASITLLSNYRPSLLLL